MCSRNCFSIVAGQLNKFGVTQLPAPFLLWEIHTFLQHQRFLVYSDDLFKIEFPRYVVHAESVSHDIDLFGHKII